jgi:hypothetical protein
LRGGCWIRDGSADSAPLPCPATNSGRAAVAWSARHCACRAAAAASDIRRPTVKTTKDDVARALVGPEEQPNQRRQQRQNQQHNGHVLPSKARAKGNRDGPRAAGLAIRADGFRRGGLGLGFKGFSTLHARLLHIFDSG